MVARTLVLLTLTGGLLAPSASAQCTVSWLNPVSGSWSTGSNWDTGSVPGPADYACITVPGTYTVTNTTGIMVDNLEVGAPVPGVTLSVSSDMAFGTMGLIADTGVLDWSSGFLTDGMLRNNGTVLLGGMTITRGVRNAGTTFLNDFFGTTVWSSSGHVRLEDSGRWENLGLIDVTGTGSLLPAGTPGTFVNQAPGRVQKSAGVGDFAIGGITLFNFGLLDAQSGTILLDGLAFHNNATLTASAGATLRLNSGLVTFEGLLQGTPSGDVVLATDVQVFGGVATLLFGGMGLQWESGYLTTDQLVNEGLVEFPGATGTRGLRLGTAFVNNPPATVRWSGSGLFDVEEGAVFINDGLVDVTTDGGLLTTLAPGPPGLFTNIMGTLTKSAGPGTFTLSNLEFNSLSGTVDARSGTLLFDTAVTALDAFSLVQGTGTVAFTTPPALQATDVGPGTSPGILTWDGEFEPRFPARLFTEIGGYVAGPDHDRLDITGNAVLTGTLDLALIGGFVPNAGDSFTILTAGAVSGSFTDVNVPPGFAFDVVYNPNDVTVIAVTLPNVEARIDPASPVPPVFIQPSGGPIDFDATLTNWSNNVQSFQAWVDAVLPNGVVFGPLFGPLSITLQPGQSVTRTLTSVVPAIAPRGVYQVRLRAGTFPSTVIDDDVFTFGKTPLPRLPAPGWTPPSSDSPLSMTSTDWPVYEQVGVPATETMAINATALPEQPVLHAAYPNPFRSQTTLRFELPEAEAVNLTVYDVQGRAVTVLADDVLGAGQHEVILDGQELATGTYVVRLTTGTMTTTHRLTLIR